MAEVRTESIRREGGGHAIVDFTLQTSLGGFPAQLRVDGGDSMADIEEIALQELEMVLTESLEAVRQKLAKRHTRNQILGSHLPAIINSSDSALR